MKKSEYVSRLKKMLTNRKDPCKCCPAEPWYKVTPTNDVSSIPKEICKTCQQFVGLNPIYDPDFTHPNGDVSAGCPCYRPGRDGAVARAWKKIIEYEKI